LAVTQREYNVVMWLRAQFGEFVSPPQRWKAEITAEGLRINGSLSKHHRVECADDGRILVDGVPVTL